MRHLLSALPNMNIPSTKEKWLHITTTLLKDKKRHSIIHYMVMHTTCRGSGRSPVVNPSL